VASVHTYIGETGDNARKVWLEQKLPAFRASCKRTGKKLIIGETGLLYNGGTYDAEMDKALGDTPHIWMVRWWDPTQFIVPEIPDRPLHDAPATGDNNDLPPPTEPEPPAQETTPETPEEPTEPTIPEPEPEGPIEEPPPVVEPPIVEPVEPSGPTPGTGKNILVELVRWLMSLFSKKK